MGEVEAALFPAPQGGIAKAPATEAVVGSRNALNPEAAYPVRTWAAQQPSAGHRSALIQQAAAGQDHRGTHPWFRQSGGAAHGFEWIEQHAGAPALNQQRAVAVAGDRDARFSLNGPRGQAGSGQGTEGPYRCHAGG